MNTNRFLNYSLKQSMNKLIIRAHPKQEEWFNKAICESIYASCMKNNHTVKIVDLYKDYQQPFLPFSREEIPHQKEIQSLITQADELILVFPIWWIDCPAILKNFFDVNMAKWFGYTINKNWKEEWLLKGKKVRIVATAGWPTFFYPFIWFISRTLGRIGYCWMKHVSTNIMAYTLKAWDSKRQRFIEKVAKRCSR